MVDVDVLIVGGGPAGLAAGTELRRLGVGRVLLVEREAQLGGVPRLCHHPGFGWRDLGMPMSGPAYARARDARAFASGVEVAVETTVTGWAGPTAVSVSSPSGASSLTAHAVLLAAGCRERPRAARLVPGSRPHGVLTTGSLQRLAHEQGIRPGRRALIVGAEHVSFSAALTLQGCGAEVVALVTEHARHQSYAPLAWWAATRRSVPILTATRVERILGGARVEAVEVRDANGVRTLACDTVVFTGGWIPEAELARPGGIAVDPRTRGPVVDTELRTSVAGVFAAGNVLRGAESADAAALEGVHAARSIARFLAHPRWCEEAVPLVVEPPLEWISPGLLSVPVPPPPRSRFTLRTAERFGASLLSAHQGDRLLAAQRVRSAVPNRSLYLSAGWLGRVDAGGGAVKISLHPLDARLE